MQRIVQRGLSAIILAACVCSAAYAADWPHWRGPNYDGVSPAKGFKSQWEAPPPKLWEAPIGSAFSGLSIVDGRVYTCGTDSDQQMLICLKADTGAVLWKTPIEPEYRERQGGDGARATPTVADGHVYVQGAKGRVLCCDAKTGAEVWSHTYDAMPRWGYSASVLVDGDLAIVSSGGDHGGIEALDRKTGKPVWQCGEGRLGDESAAGYATPYPFTFEGTRFIVGFLAKQAVIAEAKTGKLACTIPWETDWNVNAATPIFHDGKLFISSGYKTGSNLFQLAREGGQLTTKPLWGEKPNEIILGKFQSAVLHDGHLYVSDQRELKCVEFLTGKQRWSERGIKDGTVVIADGQLVVLTEGGELQIAPASAEKYAPTTKVPVLEGRCWTVPTLLDGKLYVRNLKLAACYKLAP